MKTSNKLLIVFAITILIIPTSVMIILQKSNSMPRDEYFKVLDSETKTSKSVSKYFKTLDTKQFNSISIIGNEDAHAAVSIVKSDSYAFKVSNKLADFVSYKVDDKGNLEINLGKIKSYRDGSIIIFAPLVKTAKFDMIWIDDFSANQDSLQLIAKPFSSINSHGNNLNVGKLTIVETENQMGAMVELSSPKIDTLILDVKTANITILSSQFKKVQAKADDGTHIKFSNSSTKANIIDLLQLQTTGRVNLEFENYDIKTVLGSVSDSTKLNIPTANLKQLLKK